MTQLTIICFSNFAEIIVIDSLTCEVYGMLSNMSTQYGKCWASIVSLYTLLPHVLDVVLNCGLTDTYPLSPRIITFSKTFFRDDMTVYSETIPFIKNSRYFSSIFFTAGQF